MMSRNLSHLSAVAGSSFDVSIGRFVAVLISFACLSSVWVQAQSPFTRDVFDAADLSIDNGNAFSDNTNNNGTYSFGTSYAMQAYVQMYRATGDTFYIDKLITTADNVLAQRDDVTLRFSDPSLQAPAWDRPGDFENYVGGAYASGLIIAPMVRFARLVSENPALAANPTYSAKASEYIDRSRETIAFFNDDFLVQRAPNQASYSTIRNDDRPSHPHADLTMAGVIRDFAQVVGGSEGQSLLSNVDDIQREFLDSAVYTSAQGNLAWQYSSRDLSVPGRLPDPDDLSHAANPARPLARLAVEDGSIITPAHARAFAKTIIEEVYQGGGIVAGGFSRDLDGTDRPEARAGNDPFNWSWGIAGGFIDLAQFDLRILPIAEEVQLQNYGLESGGRLWPALGIANLVRYAEVPQDLLLDVTVGEYSTAGPVAIDLTGPTQIQLINGTDPFDIQELTIELGGSGDERLREWDLSVLVDASAAPGLIDLDVALAILFLDGTGETKEITGSSLLPADFAITIGPQGGNALLEGTLQSTQQFNFFVTEAGSLVVVPEPTSFALLAIAGLLLSMRSARYRSR